MRIQTASDHLAITIPVTYDRPRPFRGIATGQRLFYRYSRHWRRFSLPIATDPSRGLIEPGTRTVRLVIAHFSPQSPPPHLQTWMTAHACVFAVIDELVAVAEAFSAQTLWGELLANTPGKVIALGSSIPHRRSPFKDRPGFDRHYPLLTNDPLMLDGTSIPRTSLGIEFRAPAEQAPGLIGFLFAQIP